MAGSFDHDHYLRRHSIFLRRGRDVSHQALFFLELLYETTGRKADEAVCAYHVFALDQVRSLYDSVRPPIPPPDENTAPRIQQARELQALWKQIGNHLYPVKGNADAAEVRTAFHTFMRRSRNGGRIAGLFVHWLPDLYNYLRKNLALLWGLVILLIVFLKVEAINSLLRNEAAGLVLPLMLLLVPLFVSRVWILILRLQGKVPFWDLSSSAFRSFRYQALEPGRFIDRWPQGAGLRREIVRGQAVKLGVYVAWWWVAFALIYTLHRNSFLGQSGSSLTVFMALSLGYALLIAAHIVDLWEYLDPWPVRFLMLIVALVAAVALLSGFGRTSFLVAYLLGAVVYLIAWLIDRQGTLKLVIAVVFLGLAGMNLWGRFTDSQAAWTKANSTPWKRLDAKAWPWPGNGPVVVVAASGGGTRAAVYTGLLLQKLNPPSQDPPQPRETALREIANHLQAISSVSGGSLANAAYIARLLDLRAAGRPDDRTAALENLVRAMSRDFLFPTLKGAMVPGMTRGMAIEEAWRRKDRDKDDEVGLGDHSLSELARTWKDVQAAGSPLPPFPIPLFNSSTLDGHDLVISPLERRLYSDDALEDEARSHKWDLCEDDEHAPKADPNDNCTWVYYRDGIYALEDLLPDFDPRLDQAVRASANFPFGFPLVRIETDEPLFFNPLPEKPKRVQLTDGGALSNSGMWSLYHLLMPEQENALDELKRRGVLLLVVEASRMPQYPAVEQSLNSLWSTIGDQGPIGQRLHRQMFNALGREYGSRIAILQWDLRARTNYNVLTSWALDNDSIEKLRKSFKLSWDSQEERLLQAWEILKAPPPPVKGKPLILTRRPPLD